MFEKRCRTVRSMKKFLCILLALCTLLLSACATKKDEDPVESGQETESQVESTEPVEKEEPFYPVLRFVAASDIHIKDGNDTQTNRLAKMVRQMTAYAKSGADGYGKLDAIALCGDITDDGKAVEFNTAKNALDANMDAETQLVITTGNHDWRAFKTQSVAEFEKIFGDKCAMKDEVIGGYHFITLVGGSDRGLAFSQADLAKAESMIEAAIADTGKDKPVFVFQHIGNLNTVAGTCTDMDTLMNTATTDLYGLQSKYENLVVFSGHSHFPAGDECSVHQDRFTSVNTGGLYYSTQSVMDGKEIVVPNKFNMAQCLLVEMDAEGRMRIRCWDVLRERFTEESWLIESFDKDAFVYTPDRFSEKDLFFAEGSKITVDQIQDSSVQISFPAVPAESLMGRVYEIVAKDQAGNTVFKEYVGVEYFNEAYDVPLKHGISGLSPNTEYTVSVRAINSLYSAEITDEGTLYSQPISASFKTASAGARDGADIVDAWIDAGKKTISNAAASQIAAQINGTPNIFKDNTIGRDVIKFSGTSGGTVKFDYSDFADRLKDSMSFEVYFKLDGLPTGEYVAVSAAMEKGGFGLLAYREGRKCQFGFHDGTKYHYLSFPYEVGKYYHVVAVYDGSVYTLYVDGEKAASVTIGGMLYFPSEAAQVLFMGGDTNAVGNGYSVAYSQCTIATLRVYSYALTAAEAKVLYNNR